MPKSSTRFSSQSQSQPSPSARQIDSIVVPSGDDLKRGVPDISAVRSGDGIPIPLGHGYQLRVGKRFFTPLILGALIYVIAALEGNEWLYLLSAGFLIGPVLAWIYPVLMLYDIEVDFSLPREVLVFETASIDIRLKRRFAAPWLRAFMPVSYFTLGVNALKRGPDGKPGERVVSAQAILIESLEEETSLKFSTASLLRGIYYIKEIEFYSSFPFGIVGVRRHIAAEEGGRMPTMTVYPKVFPTTGNFLYHLAGIPALIGISTSQSIVTHQSTFYRSVREFRHGDSLRHMHWASSARTGKLLVREFDQETQPVFDLFLNLRANWRNQDQFELAVCAVSSLVHCGHTLGKIPNLSLNPPPGSSALNRLLFDMPPDVDGVQRLMEILARVQPVTAGEDDDRVPVEGEEEAVDYSTELLAVFPSGDQVLKYFPGKGDTICYPVDLALIAQNWFDIDDETEPDLVKLVGKGGGPKKNWKRLTGPTEGEQIGRVEWEGDIETL